MKKIYVLIVFLFTIFLLGSNQNVEVKAESSSSGDLSITLNERLPKSFIVNSATPDFKPYFIVRLGTVRQEITDEQIDLGGFNVATIGEYIITATVTIETDTVTKSLTVKVVDTDTVGPTITVNKAFHMEDEFGRTPWDSQESMISFMERFTIYDEVDGYIAPNESMFLGIENVRLNRYGEEYVIWIEAYDKAGNLGIYGEIRLLIINTIGTVIIDVNEDLPVEFVVNSEAPDFKEYFKITDNITEVEITDTLIRRGGFDITKVGTYNVSIIYSREFVFDNNRDVKQVRVEFKVIEADETAPEIITYRIDDEVNLEGQLPWTYQQDLSIFMNRFRVKDNVDGIIEVTQDMFKGIELVDINTINKEYLITFEVIDKAGNIATKEVRLYVLDDVSPYITNFNNRYYRINNNIDILKVVNSVGLEDNYDDNQSILKIVINHKDLFEQVGLSYHDLERYKDQFTEEEIAAAAKAYNYELVDGTYLVTVNAFRSDDEDNILVSKQIEIVIENKKIKDLFKLYEELELDRGDSMVMYYTTNFETSKNGEYVMSVDAQDTSGNLAPNRPFRIVIENGPSLATILISINVGAIVIFGGAVGIYFIVKKSKSKAANKESE